MTRPERVRTCSSSPSTRTRARQPSNLGSATQPSMPLGMPEVASMGRTSGATHPGCRHDVHSPYEWLRYPTATAAASVVRRRLGDGTNKVTDLAVGKAQRDVSLADHANESVTVDDRQAPDAILLHRADRLLSGVVGADRDHFGLIGELADLDRLRVASLRQHLDHQVAVGDHALQVALTVADGQRTEVGVGEPLRHVSGSGIGLHPLGLCSHDLACGGHGCPPPVAWRVSYPLTPPCSPTFRYVDRLWRHSGAD